MSNPFIEQSLEMVQSLDLEQVANMQPGETLHHNPWFTRRVLGKHVIEGEALHLAIELPAGHNSAQSLFLATMVQLGYLAERAPQCMGYAPAFVGVLGGTKEGSPLARALITEDITEGGRHRLVTHSAPAMLRQRLAAASISVLAEEPRDLTVGTAGNKRKIIQFVPKPFHINILPADPLTIEVQQAQSALTLAVPTDSALGAHLSS